MDQALLQKNIYGGSVESRLAFGLLLFKEFGSILGENDAVSGTLALMRQQERALADHMTGLMLGRLCASCASTSGGGCCSGYMAGETDSLQILMNLMAGVAVARVNENPAGCCYLGAMGCIFAFKPMFCLNYNCHRIRETADGRPLRELERLAGLVLGSQYDLERLLFRSLTTYPLVLPKP